MKIYDYGGKKNICGDRIREARVVQRMSQSELAAKMQIAGIAIIRTCACVHACHRKKCKFRKFCPKYKAGLTQKDKEELS